MAITVDIACNAFIKAVMDNEFTEKVITYSYDDWWSVVVFLNFRKPRVGEHMPLVPQGSEYITIQLPDTMAKAGKTFLPERNMLTLLKAIEKYGRKEIPKKIKAYMGTVKFTPKDSIKIGLCFALLKAIINYYSNLNLFNSTSVYVNINLLNISFVGVLLA